MSCSVALRDLEGADVTTIEGLGGSHPVQQAWLAEQVTMCGYCEPGFIMTIAALLKASPSPTNEQVAALPNICRCGAYPRIRRAIMNAVQSAAAVHEPEYTAPKRLSTGSSTEAHNPPQQQAKGSSHA